VRAKTHAEPDRLIHDDTMGRIWKTKINSVRQGNQIRVATEGRLAMTPLSPSLLVYCADVRALNRSNTTVDGLKMIPQMLRTLTIGVLPKTATSPLLRIYGKGRRSSRNECIRCRRDR
jgi:hypothetical protein